jgi:hypothetical protein
MGGSRSLRLLVGTVAATAMIIGSATIAGSDAPTKRQVVVNQPPGSPPTFEVTGLSGTLAADTYKLGFANNSPVAPHVLVVVTNLPPGVTDLASFRNVVDAVETGQMEPPPDSFVGAVFSKAGQDHQKLFDMSEPGAYGYFCPIRTPDGTTGHYDMGFIGLFTVV